MHHRGRVLRLLSLLLISAVSSSLEGASPPSSTPAVGSRGAVSSAHPQATQAGIEILQKGGNAFDAAVAVAATLNVVEPMMSGMGGYGTTLVFDAESGQCRFLNSSGRIPRGVESDAFRPPTPGYLENRRGAKSISTPGNVNAWAELASRGRLAWTDLLRPARRVAVEGFPLADSAARFLASAWDDFPPHARQIYGRDGRPLLAGERLVQTDLEHSLAILAEQGARAFFEGPLAKVIVEEVAARGGFLVLRDLEENRAEWWPCIGIDYRERRVVTAAPPANSFPALIRLGMASRFPFASMVRDSADTLHLVAEISKRAFSDRLRFAGDPEINPPPLDRLLSPTYWAEQAGGIDAGRASTWPLDDVAESSQNTTHFVVADRWGNVVSSTQTLGNIFGSRIMPPGTGIWLNNSLAYCTFEPKGNPMDAHPGRRKLSGDVPLFLLDDRGRPVLAVGTPGGHGIAQMVPQIVMNHVDWGMDIARAIAASRIVFSEDGALMVEESIPAGVRAELERRGHRLKIVPALGNAHGLTIAWGDDGRPASFAAAADPRYSGLAAGW